MVSMLVHGFTALFDHDRSYRFDPLSSCAPALCMAEDDPARSYIISTMIFVTGLVTRIILMHLFELSRSLWFAFRESLFTALHQYLGLSAELVNQGTHKKETESIFWISG